MLFFCDHITAFNMLISYLGSYVCSSALALHLLQASLVYVNTRMLQTVLVEPKWAGRMTPEDYRGLTPLIYSHVTPYGRFDLDLTERIDFGRLAAGGGCCAYPCWVHPRVKGQGRPIRLSQKGGL